MRSKLVLSLASAQLRVEAQSLAPRGMQGLLRSLVPGRKPLPAPDFIARIVLNEQVKGHTLPELLEQALSELQATHGALGTAPELEVQLGLDHAHIGLMVLEDMKGSALSSEARKTYAQAWVRRMLHRDPQTQVIRWQVLADARKLLISCVSRDVFDVLQQFCVRHGLRFASCRPAVLSTFGEGAGKAAAARTVVWTEAANGAPRAHSIQLLRIERGQLSAAWRGWVPGENAAEGAIRRFQAHSGVPTGEIATHVHWPSASSFVQ